MASAEQGFILFAFLLIGIVVGYVTFLIFRIAVHQQRFEWSGALSVITSLAGGGFLSYWSQPRNFAAYGIGFFIGFAAYWRFRQSPGIVTGSTAAPLRASTTKMHLTLGSQAASSDDSESRFGVRLDPDTGLPSQSEPTMLPEEAVDLIRTIADVNVSTERRVKALLALRTREHSENIDITDSLWHDLDLIDLCLFPVILRVGLPTLPQPFQLNTVKDLINMIDGKP